MIMSEPEMENIKKDVGKNLEEVKTLASNCFNL